MDECFFIQIVVEDVFHAKANAGGFVIQLGNDFPPAFGVQTLQPSATVSVAPTIRAGKSKTFHQLAGKEFISTEADNICTAVAVANVLQITESRNQGFAANRRTFLSGVEHDIMFPGNTVKLITQYVTHELIFINVYIGFKAGRPESGYHGVKLFSGQELTSDGISSVIFVVRCFFGNIA